jgi:Leucine-rich repeat (LRR) protein
MEELQDLRSLDLSHNKLAELPISIYFNPLLASLKIAGNGLKQFP